MQYRIDLYEQAPTEFLAVMMDNNLVVATANEETKMGAIARVRQNAVILQSAEPDFTSEEEAELLTAPVTEHGVSYSAALLAA